MTIISTTRRSLNASLHEHTIALFVTIASWVFIVMMLVGLIYSITRDKLDLVKPIIAIALLYHYVSVLDIQILKESQQGKEIFTYINLRNLWLIFLQFLISNISSTPTAVISSMLTSLCINV